MLERDLKKLLGVLEWETKHKFRSHTSGGLAPMNRGRGIEFKEVRPYTFGDDTRYIDWNVTSRTGEIHVKEYFTEQDVPVVINVDCSASMSNTKQHAALQLAFFLCLFHIKMGNRVRIFLFAEEVYHSGIQIKREEDAYAEFKKIVKQSKIIKTGKTDYNKALNLGMKISPKFSVSYWLSDFCYFDGFSKLAPLINKWEQYGIWIKEVCLENELPFWFKIFNLIDSEEETLLGKNSTLENDKQIFLKCFGKKQVIIRPEMKLSNQISALFTGNKL